MEKEDIKKEKIEIECNEKNGDSEKNGNKRGRLIAVCTAVMYVLMVGGYFAGKELMKGTDLSYRFWVDAVFCIVAWFVPVIVIGIGVYGVMNKLQKIKKKLWQAIGIGGFILYIIFAGNLSIFYGMCCLFNMTYDEKMIDGNLVVTVPHGFDSYHYYAESVGGVLRKRIEFDEIRCARSLSKVYGVEFISKRNGEDEVVYVSDAYPNVEVQILRHGYAVNNYLDTDLCYQLTSEAIARHADLFSFWDVELQEYTWGVTEANPNGYGTVYAPIITPENKEAAAQAITEFIQMTLEQDERTDGESLWKNVDGSIFLYLVGDNSQTVTTRNIPFSTSPKYSWIYGEDVTVNEILELLEK